MEEIIAANYWHKLISGAPYGVSRKVSLKVNASLVKRAANDYPYYSITGSVELMDKRYREPVITCGAIHDTIVKHYPELAPLIAVHLSAVTACQCTRRRTPATGQAYALTPTAGQWGSITGKY
jgi:hypothetical protein